jgi:hypothetical protein
VSGTAAADANVQFAANECTSYDPLDPNGVTVANTAVTLGGSTSLPLDSAASANTAAALARHFNKLCIVGKGGSPAQQVLVWLPQPPAQSLSDVPTHGCQAYLPDRLQVVPLGGFQTVQDSSSGVALATLASAADANRAIQVARDHHGLCWIGGGSGANSLLNVDYGHAVLFWD